MKQAESYRRSSTNFRQNNSYRLAYETDRRFASYAASLNSGRILNCGSFALIGVIEPLLSSKSIRYPAHGRTDGTKVCSRNAVHRSVALPIASSTRLLQLFPNDGPACDFSSIAASRFPAATTIKSQSFVGRKNPGISFLLLLKMQPDEIPDSSNRSQINLAKSSMCLPPVTSALAA